MERRQFAPYGRHALPWLHRTPPSEQPQSHAADGKVWATQTVPYSVGAAAAAPSRPCEAAVVKHGCLRPKRTVRRGALPARALPENPENVRRGTRASDT